jgi:hypothetical protein
MALFHFDTKFQYSLVLLSFLMKIQYFLLIFLFFQFKLDFIALLTIK